MPNPQLGCPRKFSRGGVSWRWREGYVRTCDERMLLIGDIEEGHQISHPGPGGGGDKSDRNLILYPCGEILITIHCGRDKEDKKIGNFQSVQVGPLPGSKLTKNYTSSIFNPRLCRKCTELMFMRVTTWVFYPLPGGRRQLSSSHLRFLRRQKEDGPPPH